MKAYSPGSELDQKIQYVGKALPGKPLRLFVPRIERLIQRGSQTSFYRHRPLAIPTLQGNWPTSTPTSLSLKRIGHHQFRQSSVLLRSQPTKASNLCGMAAGAASQTGKLVLFAANPFGQVKLDRQRLHHGGPGNHPDAPPSPLILHGAWNDR